MKFLRFLASFAATFSKILSFNIDTNSPIVYVDPSIRFSVNKSSYFGYTVALFPEKNINNAGIYIGAPRSNDLKVKYRNPGAIFSCGTPGKCHLITLDTEEEVVTERRRIKYINKLDNAWIGGSMDINYEHERIATCGYRWINKYEKVPGTNIHEDYHMEGSCYWWHLYDNETAKLTPLVGYDKFVYTISKVTYYYYGQGQAGVSLHMPTDRTEMLIGAPGVYNWHGTPILYSDIDDTPPIASKYKIIGKRHIEQQEFSHSNIANAVNTIEVTSYDLLGYSSTSGHFYNKGRQSKLQYVSGAPRSSKYLGQVLIYEFAKTSDVRLNVVESKRGTQFGEYFGASVSAGDINNDGYDDLIVGAPYYAEKKYNEGRIFVFLGSKTGRLQVPNQGKVIVGGAVNGQFGTTLQYLGDLNEDGFGDMAVSAPYEENGGVVYIFRGTKNGLDVTPVQRIAGHDIVQDIRGFGMSISRPADINGNGHKDLAIGAYISGHVILLRTAPIVTIYHKLKSFTPRLKYDDTSFVMEACFYFHIQENEAQIKIRRFITLDDKLKRATLKNGNNRSNKTITLNKNIISCDNFTVSLERKKSTNSYDPITISLEHELVHERRKREAVYVRDNGIEGTDYFCVRCPVYNKYNSSKVAKVNIPFTLGCKSEDVCKSALEFDVNLSFTNGNDNMFVLGSTNYVTLHTTVQNSGENAYLTQVVITLPEIINFRQIPAVCTEQNTTSILCDVDNPLKPKSGKSIITELDMSNINSGKYDEDSVDIFIKVSTSSDNSIKDFRKLTIQLKREADITISGKSEEQTYPYGEATHGKPNFTQIYQVEEFGASPIEEVRIEIEIPHKIKSGEQTIDLLSLRPPIANLGGQPITCNSNFTYIVKNQDGGDPLFASSDNHVMKLRRSPRESEVEVFNNKSVSQKENIIQNAEFDVPINRTFFIDCSLPEIICSKVVCTAGPFRSNQIANIEIEMLSDITKIKKLLGKSKDVILLSTRAFVYIQRPENFIQDGVRPDSVHVSTVLVGDTVEGKVETWIIVLAVIAGLLLLLLLIMGLIKAGFFKRKTKEELEQLKKEAEDEANTEFNEVEEHQEKKI